MKLKRIETRKKRERKVSGHVKNTSKINEISKKSIISSLDEFAQNTTLHGLSYIADRTLSHVEKLFWTLVVAASIIMCSLLIRNVWIKWQNSPIIITMNERLIPVDSISYPSLTICPQIKIKKNKFNFSTERDYFQEFMWNAMKETKASSLRLGKTADIALVCDTDLRLAIFNIPLSYYEANVNNILDVALDFEDIFESCEWNNDNIDCQSLFQKVVTSEGVCFTTNVLDSVEILRAKNKTNKLFLSNENYRDNLSTVYPIQGSVNDASPEFSIILREYADYDDRSCRRYSTGFLVYVQDPADMPYSSIHPHVLKPNQIISLALKFDSVSTSEDLESYPIQTRQCYYPHEPYLQFFRTYTMSNCRLECFTNYTKKLCACVAFYMPYNNGTRICPIHFMSCVDMAQILLYGNKRPEKINRLRYTYAYLIGLMNDSVVGMGKEFANACNCLPTCNTVNYDTDIIKTDYDFEYYYDFYCSELDICNRDNNVFKYSKLEWIFKRPSFAGMVRSSVFGTTDFIAQCGGLLGLFLGFSFLTVVEILFYVTLRLFCLIKNEKTKHFNNQEVVN